MKEEFVSKEMRIKEVQDKIVELQKEIDLINNEDKKRYDLLKERILNLSSEAQAELINIKETLTERPQFFNGCLERYRNVFDKTITSNDFKNMLDNIKSK